MAPTSQGMSCSAAAGDSQPADYSTVDITVRTAAGAAGSRSATCSTSFTPTS